MAGSDAPRSSIRTLTLDELIRSRSPGLDLVRLVLAFLVLVSHTWTLGGFGPEPSSPLTPVYLTLGGFAVAGFFALSGMLVGRSALTRPSGTYAWARVLRIMPAFWVALVIGGFVVAGLGYVHGHHSLSGFLTLEPGGPVTHVARGALFPLEFPYGVHDVFVADTPFGRATGSSFVNGSLWTLPHELRCYLVVGLLAVVARRHGDRRTITIGWMVVGAMAVAYWRSEATMDFVLSPLADRQLIAFLFVFMSGTLAAVWANHIRVFGVAPVLALVAAIVAGRTSLFLSEHVAGAALVLLLPPVAVLLAPIGRRLHGIDLSYGLYLYAWPVQQLVAMYALADTPATFIAVSTVFTVSPRGRELVPDRAPVDASLAPSTGKPGMSDRALPADERPDDDTPVHTADLPDTPTRDRNIVAHAWVEAPAELLGLGDDLPHRAPGRYKRRIGTWLLWRVGPGQWWRCPVHGRRSHRSVAADDVPAVPRQLG